MSGHRVTPFALTATKKFAREKKDEPILLASIGKDRTIDLLDAVDAHLTSVQPVARGDGSLTVQCLRTQRDGDYLSMIFAADVTGEREVVRDGVKQTVVFTKGKDDVTRTYSAGLIWRPPGGTEGLLLVHSPWGRGGNRFQILTLLQRAVTAEEGAIAKVHADPIIPAKALDRILRNANATRITYVKSKRITSTMDGSSQSTRAEMDLVVKGSDSIPYRDALARALKASANREKLFTLQMPDEDDPTEVRDETFDDVFIDIATGGGNKRYSMRRETIPTISKDLTPEINNIYFGLGNDDDAASWADGLLSEVPLYLKRFANEVQVDLG
jgi:hypothetical protein